ncbi:MAG: SDR family oxidoreductase [Deltaproteobacteria bacterium]|nr:SDR family oxidoreductase [Deltaproteobacteria bacterium]
MNGIKKVLVTGGAGYVGAVLVPKLLKEGYQVKVVDLYIFGEKVLDQVKDHPGLEQIRGDIRNRSLFEKIIPGSDAVIHLACISNDPSFELDPVLGKSINYDAFLNLVDISRQSGVQYFIYASSSSVYGVKEEDQVTEDLPLEPLTDYSKYKALCEEYLNARKGPMTSLIIRPATVCGYSPRLRLDLTVNILTHHALINKQITVFGGDQQRPNIHIEDMTDLYLEALKWPAEEINGKIYNAGYQNHTVMDLARSVRRVVGDEVAIKTSPTNDIRSYRVSSEKIKQERGFIPQYTIENAVQDLMTAFQAGKVPDSMTDPHYVNIKMLQKIGLK